MERRCITSGQCLPKAELIRFVVGPDDQVVPDLANDLPGRGIWVSAKKASIEVAAEKNAFSKAAKQKVVPVAPEVLSEQVERLLATRALQLLGLANKAGLVVTGFNKVEPMLRAGKASLLLGASDASPDGRRKLAGLRGNAPIFEILSGEELDGVLGKMNVVHLGLKAGGLTKKITEELQKLMGFRGGMAE